MLFRERVAVYCENHMEHTNTLCGQNAKFYELRWVVHLSSKGVKIFCRLRLITTIFHNSLASKRRGSVRNKHVKLQKCSSSPLSLPPLAGISRISTNANVSHDKLCIPASRYSDSMSLVLQFMINLLLSGN
jgi:hypothetical protein